MNENIISPLFIYLLYNINSFIFMSIVIAIVSILLYFIYFTGCSPIKTKYNMEIDTGEKEIIQWKKQWGKIPKILQIISIISLLIAVFAPNKNTLVAMYIAKNITYAKVNTAIEKTTNFKDTLKKDIIEIIVEVSKTKNNTTK